MSIKSLTRIYCDKCNPNMLNGGAPDPTYRGVLTLAHPMDRLINHDWQVRGNEHWCSICVKEEQDGVHPSRA